MRRPARRYTPRRSEVPDREAENRQRELELREAWFLVPTIDPPELAEVVGERCRIERDRLAAAGVPIEERIAALEAFDRAMIETREADLEAVKDCYRGDGWYESAVDGGLRRCGGPRRDHPKDAHLFAADEKEAE